MPAPSQNIADNANAKPNTIAFCGKMVVCSSTPCASSATNSSARPDVLMPEAADDAGRPVATGTGGTLSSMGRTAACRCERQPATARPP